MASLDMCTLVEEVIDWSELHIGQQLSKMHSEEEQSCRPAKLFRSYYSHRVIPSSFGVQRLL